MSLEPMQYLLFPYTILSESEYRQLSILLPRLSLLQVIRPPAVPNWLHEQVTGWPVIQEPGRLEAITLCLKGYQQFASVHGENSALASLSLDQISRDFAESRFRIQNQLKREDPDGSQDEENSLAEAAILLEMARDLDEKEVELAASLTKIDDLEGEFREILGISDEDELADANEILSPPLRAEKGYLSFMLPKRIASWLRLFCSVMPEAGPTLVTTSEAVLEELFDPIRAEYERAGKTFEPERVLLGSIPSLDDLEIDEFLSLLSNPEASARFASSWHALESMLRAPHDPPCREQMSVAADTLQDFLRQHRRELDLPEGPEVRMELIFDSNLRWGSIGKYYEPVGQSEPLRAASCPDDVVRILLCRF
jgi:hypothetical protein